MIRFGENARMLAYVLDAADLGIKDILEFEDFEFNTDTEFAEKSQIVVSRKPDVAEGDFIVCQADGGNLFTGICGSYKSASDSSAYTLTLRQQECFFDRFIFPAGEGLISSTGIEDFIAAAITANWISSGDASLDLGYLTVTAVTHTPVQAKVSTIAELTDGAYNLKTFLGNAMEFYGIYTAFDFSVRGELTVRVYHSTDEDASVDATVSDVTAYDETYAVDALAKLCVKWKLSDDDASPTSRTFYLLADRTITEDGSDPGRASGSVRSMEIVAETEAEMRQQVADAFASNSYQHKISFQLLMVSRLYDYTTFYPGHAAVIKTKTGIRRSIVTGLSVSSASRFAGITFGKLKVTLIEKLRRTR